MTRTALLTLIAALAALTTGPATARADRLSFELGAGGGAYSDGGDDARYGVALSVGVGIATSRRLAFDLRYLRVQELGGDGGAERFFFLGPMAQAFVGERVFLGLGLGMAGAGGVGPAVDARVGAVLSTTASGYVYGSLDLGASVALDGDTDPARAAVLLVGYRGR